MHWTSATPSDAHTSSSKSRHRFTRLYRRVGCAGWTRGSEECKRRLPGLARGLVSTRLMSADYSASSSLSVDSLFMTRDECVKDVAMTGFAAFSTRRVPSRRRDEGSAWRDCGLNQTMFVRASSICLSVRQSPARCLQQQAKLQRLAAVTSLLSFHARRMPRFVSR